MIRRIRCSDKTQMALLMDCYSYEIVAEEEMLGTGRRIKVYYDFLVDEAKLSNNIQQVDADIKQAIDNKIKEINK